MPRKAKGGPATDPELLILASLASGPKHGYGIMLDIRQFADVTIGPGTLYTAITRLVERKLVAPVAEANRQRPYRITPAGTALLQKQLNDMRRVASLGLRRLRLT